MKEESETSDNWHDLIRQETESFPRQLGPKVVGQRAQCPQMRIAMVLPKDEENRMRAKFLSYELMKS